jgi:hypothetical protein
MRGIAAGPSQQLFPARSSAAKDPQPHPRTCRFPPGEPANRHELNAIGLLIVAGCVLATGRALSFGVMAEAYERFRPGYPVELFDMVMMHAGQPVRTALEIGAGTGRATRLFAQRGVTVTAPRRAVSRPAGGS